MELDTSKKRKSELSSDTGDINLNLYNKVPFGLLTLEECEDLFRQRLEAYAIFEKNNRTDRNNAELVSALRNIKSYVHKSNCIVTRWGDKTQQKQDHYSHMLMRMFCLSEPGLWAWFKSNERNLLYHRLKDLVSSLSGSKFETILAAFKFNVDRVIGSDFNELVRENLLGNRKDQDIFKVKWTDALRFVAKRSVPLKLGYAYLTKFEMISIACDAFDRFLEKELQYARQHFDPENMQIRQLVESMNLVYQDFKEKLEDERRAAKQEQADDNRSPYVINLLEIEQIVKDHYPPCMRYLHDSLLLDHHLKHMGRLHYGAFLRSGGVQLDDAIEFWRKEFTKKIPNDKFERDYKYNIRHLYGKEGHKKKLSCFSCDKIINDSNPGPTDKHGCPFRHFGDDSLKTLLKKYGLDPEEDMEDIFMAKKDKNFKGACGLLFEKIKGRPMSDEVRNPMQFYYASRARQLMEAKGIEGGETENVPAHADPAEDWDDF